MVPYWPTRHIRKMHVLSRNDECLRQLYVCLPTKRMLSNEVASYSGNEYDTSDWTTRQFPPQQSSLVPDGVTQALDRKRAMTAVRAFETPRDFKRDPDFPFSEIFNYRQG